MNYWFFSFDTHIIVADTIVDSIVDSFQSVGLFAYFLLFGSLFLFAGSLAATYTNSLVLDSLFGLAAEAILRS